MPSPRGLFVVNRAAQVAVILFGGGVRARNRRSRVPHFQKYQWGISGLGIDLIHGRRPLGDLGGPLCFGEHTAASDGRRCRTAKSAQILAALRGENPAEALDWTRGWKGGRRKKGDGGRRHRKQRNDGEEIEGSMTLRNPLGGSRRGVQYGTAEMVSCFADAVAVRGSAAAELPL